MPNCWKRIIDFVFSLICLIVFSPILLMAILAILYFDRQSPFYVAERIGKRGVPFRMFKLQTLKHSAQMANVYSTSADDVRITAIGRVLRKTKLDEIPQLINVLKGEMSLVGPRPNVSSEVDRYSLVEKRLLEVKPGITDFASVVFSDESEILKGKPNPDLTYNRLIRPWKSRLGLVYVENVSIYLDLSLILITIMSLFSRRKALIAISRVLEEVGAEEDLRTITRREKELTPHPPPGFSDVVEY